MDLNSRPNSADSSSVRNQSQNAFYHYNNTSQQSFEPQFQQQFWSQNNEYLTQYYSQYYREYYRKLLLHQNQQQLVVKQPLKYGSRLRHSLAKFSQNNNQLFVVKNDNKLDLFSLKDILIDYLYPNQYLSLLLSSNESTQQSLPFNNYRSIHEWLNARQQLQQDMNFELKLIIKIIQMLLKQNINNNNNFVLTGLDLSELLFEYFSGDLTQYSPENNELNSFRLLLIKGQKRLALNYAINNGLSSHALTLAYLLNEQKREDLMIGTIRKFMSNSLHISDPIYVLYSAMISTEKEKQFLQNLSFESFLMLLSNEMPLNYVEFNQNYGQNFKHLLLLIKSLMTTTDDQYFILNEELFDSKMDFILINECLEFSRFFGQKFNPKLIENKLHLISLLFDFGFYGNAYEYCKQLKTLELSTTATRIIYEFESRFDRNCYLTEPEIQYNNDNDAVINNNNDNNTTEVVEENVAVVDPTDGLISETTTQTQQVIDNQNMTTMPLSPENTSSFDFYGQLMSPMSALTTTTQQPFELNNSYNNYNNFNTFEDNSMTAPSAQPEVQEVNDNSFSFISTSASLPTMPFETTNSNSNEMPINSNNDLTDNRTENNSKEQQLNRDSNSGNFFTNFLGKLRPKNQAILPDDRNMSLVYDKARQKWVDKSDADVSGGSGGALSANIAPPVGPPLAIREKKFQFKSNKRYVDVFNK